MKEVNLFSAWADTVLEDASQPSRMGTPMKAMADRPLPRELDIQYKAQRKYPELSPEQAMAKYLEDELDNNEKVDKKQGAQAQATPEDAEKDEQSIKTDLTKVAHDEAQIQAEINRLMQLVKTGH